MVICFRCQVNISEFECEICKGCYCAECDKFIHSKKPKNNHIRKQLKILTEQIKEKEEPEKPLDFKPNLTYSKKSINVNDNIINEKKIENNNINEGYPLPQTYQIERNYNFNNNNINEENFEPNNREEINDNNNQDYLSQNMNNCIENINNIMNKDYKFKLDEVDTEIVSLQKQIEEQRALINRIKQENNKIEHQIEETNSQLDTLNQEKDRLINEKKTINEFYEEKKNEIEKIHELDKYKLIEDYEDQMRQISQNYLNKKTEYIQGMQDIEDKIREIENNKEDEKRMMLEEIDRLKNEGNNIDKEQEYLIKSNDELNSKLKETSDNIDLLRANTLGNNTTKKRGIIKVKSKGN